MATLLIIFAKEPVPGQVKTRLCPPLTTAAAAHLYRVFVADILEEMGRLREVRLVLAYSPVDARAFFQVRTPPGFHLIPQTGADLGERLARAFAWGFEAGGGAVLVRGSDSPDLPGEIILEAAAALGSGSEVVLGPCPDGGYYLVGLRRPRPELFQGLAWSSDTVLAATLARAERLALPVHLLPSWPDIDTFADLQAFLKRPRRPPAPGWRTYEWAQNLEACRQSA